MQTFHCQMHFAQNSMMHKFVPDPCQIAAYSVDIAWAVVAVMHSHFDPSMLNSFALMDAKHFHRPKSVVIYLKLSIK